MPLVCLPVDPPTPTPATLELLNPAAAPWPTGRALLDDILAQWPMAHRGELAALEDDDPTWAVLGWSPCSDLDEATDLPQHWDDRLELDGPLPDPLPAELALTLASSPLLIRFDHVPSIPDGSTQVVRCLPWWTAETLVEHLCERHGLIRRLTLGGETRSRGKDRWGGGTRVEYRIEEVWADRHGRERSLAVTPEAFVASLLERPLHESPFPDPLARPTYRFCIPDSWLLRSPRPEAVSTLVLDGSAEPKDDDTTVKNGRSVAAAGKERPAPNPNGSDQVSGKRYSLFGSLLQTLIPAAAAGESESVAPSARPPPLKKRSGIDRMSVSEPVTGPSPIIEPSPTVLGAVTDSNHEEVVEDDEDNDEHWQSIFDRFAIRSPEAQARIKAMPAQKRNELFSKTGPSAASAAASISRGSAGEGRRLSLAGTPPSSFKSPGSGEPERIEPQRTGGSAGGSKRFSIASLAGWGDPDDEPTPLPLTKQDTGGWSAWWIGTRESDGDPYIVGAVKELSLSTVTNIKIRTSLGSLSRTLASAPKEICEEFIELRGIDALRKVLARLVRPPIQERGELASQSAVEILSILQSVMRYGGATHSAVISDAELMSLLTLAFDVPSFKVGTALAKLLTGLAILPDPLNTAVVLEAFSAGRLLTGDRFRFQRLVDCLGSHDDWEGVDNAYAIDEHRFSVLLFIGRLCAADIDDVEARVLLRDEFERTGMKEQMVAIRYSQPPERVIDCLEDWKDDAARDRQELQERRQALLQCLADDVQSRAGSLDAGDLEDALGRLRLLAGLLRESDVLASTVSAILGSIIEIVQRDVDSYTKDTLLNVLQACGCHIAELDDSSEWRLALRSVASTLGDDAVADGLGSDLELVRAENEDLHEEVRSLKDALRQKEIEETVFKELPARISEGFGSTPLQSSNLAKEANGAEAISHQGLVLRLLQKEKDLVQLRIDLDQLGKKTAREGSEAETKAKRDRDRAREAKHKMELEASNAKLRLAEEREQQSQAALAFTRRALDTVHARFSALVESDPEGEAVSMLPAPARPDVLATEVINTLTRREDEIRSLRVELEQLRRQAADRKRASLSSVSSREEKDFKARVAPPPPPPPSALRASAAVPRQSDHVSVSDLASRASDLANAAPTSDAVNALASPTSASSSASATATSTEGEPTGSADVRSALFAAIRSKPKASAEPLSDPDPLPDVPDRSALMAALRSRSAPAAKGPASSPAGSSTPSASSPDPVSVSTGAAAQDPTAAPDLRAALMTALRSRPAASFDITPTAEGPDPTPAPATDLRPTAAAPTASLVSESNGAAGPTVDLRAALMAGIRKGPPAKSASPQVAPRAPPAAAPSKKLKPFFWKKLASDEVQATIWSDLPKEILALDLVELEQTFSIAPAKATASKGASSRRPQAITFLDIPRSNNIGILLAKLKLPITNISHAILIIDDETLGLDDLKNLSRLLPTSEEMSRITAFEDVSKLAKPDLYFKEIGRIPRLETRLECMLFRSRFDLDLQETIPDLEKLASATRQLRSSVKFKKVLQIVLCIGNALNTATFRGGASGFAMEALLKLRETRTARSDCPTLLHFVARTIVKTSPSLAMFIEDMPSVSAAARINVATVSQSVAQLVSGVAKVAAETTLVRAAVDRPTDDRFAPVMDAFVTRVGPDVERVQALGQRVGKEISELLAYFGEQAEGPEATRPEDFFGMVLTFSMALQTAAAEVTNHLAAKPATPLQKRSNQINALLPSRGQVASAAGTRPPHASADKLLAAVSGPSAAAGELDAAIRSLHHSSVARTRRAEHDRSQQRPLSKMFLDGGANGTTRTVGGATTIGRSRGGDGTIKESEGRRSLASMFVA